MRRVKGTNMTRAFPIIVILLQGLIEAHDDNQSRWRETVIQKGKRVALVEGVAKVTKKAADRKP
jgi:hypothetical protein